MAIVAAAKLQEGGRNWIHKSCWSIGSPARFLFGSKAPKPEKSLLWGSGPAVVKRISRDPRDVNPHIDRPLAS